MPLQGFPGARLSVVAAVRWREWCAALLMGAVVGGMAWFNQGRMDPVLYDISAGNVWFQADPWRVIANETRQDSNHYRNIVHPLYSLLTFPAVALMRGALGLDPMAAVKLFHALIAAFWGGLLHATLRLTGRTIPEAMVFTLLGAMSASALFWFSIPETYGLGSLTLLAALAATAASRFRTLAPWQHVALNAATLSVTVTNWMAGIFAALALQPWRRALRTIAIAFAIVALLAILQRLAFPSSQLFFFGSREELDYLLRDEAGGAWATTRALLFHSLLMPEIRYLDGITRGWRIMSVQLSPIAGGLAVGAALLWTAMLGLGVAALRQPAQRKLAFVLAGIGLGQVVLHALYGDETFLYSLHLMPVLVVTAACGARIAPRASLALALMLILAAAANNLPKLEEAQAWVRQGPTPPAPASIR